MLDGFRVLFLDVLVDGVDMGLDVMASEVVATIVSAGAPSVASKIVTS